MKCKYEAYEEYKQVQKLICEQSLCWPTKQEHSSWKIK